MGLAEQFGQPFFYLFTRYFYATPDFGRSPDTPERAAGNESTDLDIFSLKKPETELYSC